MDSSLTSKEKAMGAVGGGGREGCSDFGHRDGQRLCEKNEGGAYAWQLFRDVCGCMASVIYFFIGIASLIVGFGILMVLDPKWIFAPRSVGSVFSMGIIVCIFILVGTIIIIRSVTVFRDTCQNRARTKAEELSRIATKCRYHPEKDIQDVVRTAISGAKFWTFNQVWKKFRDSHDYGTVFTGILR